MIKWIEKPGLEQTWLETNMSLSHVGASRPSTSCSQGRETDNSDHDGRRYLTRLADGHCFGSYQHQHTDLAFARRSRAHPCYAAGLPRWPLSHRECTHHQTSITMFFPLFNFVLRRGPSVAFCFFLIGVSKSASLHQVDHINEQRPSHCAIVDGRGAVHLPRAGSVQPKTCG